MTLSSLVLAVSAAQWILLIVFIIPVLMLRPAPQEQTRRAQARHSNH